MPLNYPGLITIFITPLSEKKKSAEAAPNMNSAFYLQFFPKKILEIVVASSSSVWLLSTPS